MTTQEIRDRIKDGWFQCKGIDCSVDENACPFDSPKNTGCSAYYFDFSAMKLGTETELKDLLKYKSKDNKLKYPNLK